MLQHPFKLFQEITLTEPVHLKVTAGHIWQGPILESDLQRLKSFAMTGLKNFWATDLEEYSTFQFIPFDDAATLYIETEDEDLFEFFEEENTLSDFPQIKLQFVSTESFEIKIPENLSLRPNVIKKLNTIAHSVSSYMETIQRSADTRDGYSSVILGYGAFVDDITLEDTQRPTSANDIFTIVSFGETQLGEFEFFHGLIIRNLVYEMATPGPESEVDSFYHRYVDENFNLMMSFNQWFAGLEVDEIGETYVSEIPEALIDAYISTDFKIQTEPEITINIGTYSSALSILQKEYDCETSAFITAWNPYGKALSEEDNLSRNQKLYETISEKYKVLEGIGVDPEGIWPGEASYLILGITRIEAMKLGVEFEQNAIVFVEDSVPELVMLR